MFVNHSEMRSVSTSALPTPAWSCSFLLINMVQIDSVLAGTQMLLLKSRYWTVWLMKAESFHWYRFSLIFSGFKTAEQLGASTLKAPAGQCLVVCFELLIMFRVFTSKVNFTPCEIRCKLVSHLSLEWEEACLEFSWGQINTNSVVFCKHTYIRLSEKIP